MTNKPDPNEGVEFIKNLINTRETNRKHFEDAFGQYGWQIETRWNGDANAYKIIECISCVIRPETRVGGGYVLFFAEVPMGTFNSPDELLAYMKDVEESLV